MIFETENFNLLINALIIIISIRVFKWLFDYSYKVWVYSYVNGPPIVPFLGNYLSLNSSKSGKILIFIYFW